MTRMYFELIAATLNTCKDRASGSDSEVIDRVIAAMALALKATSPGFKADRFVAACNKGLDND